jgi:hypothetical protein
MAPAVGPTTALAMCAAAFVGWRVPFEQAQSLEPNELDEPDVPDSTIDKELSDPDTDEVLSGVEISNDFCESAAVQEHIWQHQNTSSKTTMAHAFGRSDNLGDGAVDNHWECGHGAMEFAHDSKAMLHNTSILVDHEGSQSMQQSSMFPLVDGDDDSNSLCDSDSEKESSHFDCQSFLEPLNGSGSEQEACPQVPSEFANTPKIDLPVESDAVMHSNEFESWTELAMMETEAVSEVKELASSSPSDLSVESKAVIHNDEFGSLTEVAVNMQNEIVSEMPPHSYDVLDIRADQDLAVLDDDVTAGWNTEGHDQSSIFQDMPDKFFEFLVWSWQACCTECRKVLSEDNLEKALGALHQLWHSCLAISRSVLGEELFLKVSEVMAQWWRVILLCVTSLVDLVFFGASARFLLCKVLSCCRRGTREPVPAELDVADTKTNADSCEKPICPFHEQIETARSVTLQVPAPIHDAGANVDALKNQRSPFNPAIQMRNIPTPVRRVAPEGFAASRQNIVATSVSTESA